MSDFIEKNQNFNVSKELKEVQHEIALAMFNVNHCVDSGNSHIELVNTVKSRLDLIYDIPTVCKVNLDDQVPPLFIKFANKVKVDDLQIFASYSNT